MCPLLGTLESVHRARLSVTLSALNRAPGTFLGVPVLANRLYVLDHWWSAAIIVCLSNAFAVGLLSKEMATSARNVTWLASGSIFVRLHSLPEGFYTIFFIC
jgi:hypothetical protein